MGTLTITMTTAMDTEVDFLRAVNTRLSIDENSTAMQCTTRTDASTGKSDLPICLITS